MAKNIVAVASLTASGEEEKLSFNIAN